MTKVDQEGGGGGGGRGEGNDTDVGSEARAFLEPFRGKGRG